MNPNLKAGPGRPKGSKNKAPLGLAAYIRERTRDGEELADIVVTIARGERPKGSGKPPTLGDRLTAITWLADRGYGKPKQSVDVGTSDALAELLQAALGLR